MPSSSLAGPEVGAGAIVAPVLGVTAPGIGVPAALGLIVLTEAAVPLPVPADLLMLFVGERAAAGAVPLWLAVLGLEASAMAGTTLLFLALRGPARALVPRLGPRVGLTDERLGRAGELLERRGRAALAVGRGTPGLRTLTVAAAALAGLAPRKALPALLLGASVFVQLHLVLGYTLGPVALELVERALPVAVVVLVVLLAGAVVFWVARRGGRGGARSWSEAACPACLALDLVASRVGPEISGAGPRRRRPWRRPARP